MERSIKENYHIILLSYHKPSMNWLIDYFKKYDIKKIAYIMNAAKEVLSESPNYKYNDRDNLVKAGFKVDIIDLDSTKDLENTLLSYDVIYVRGGNTFCLLESVQNSGFDKILPKLLEKGKIYASSSAGSILLSPSIEIVENDFMSDKNIVGLTDMTGLGLVDFAVFPHWEDRFENDLNRLVSKLNIKYPIKKLKDNQLILIKNGKSKLIEV